MYRTETTYIAPIGSMAICRDGEILAGFREAHRGPLWSHVDPSSRAAMLRSTDGGSSWGEHAVLYDDDQAIQDPCLSVLSDGTVICNFFKWQVGTEEDLPVDPPPGRLTRRGWDAVHAAWTLGTYVLKSTDKGRSWKGDPVQVETPLGKATLTSDPVIELAEGDLLIPLYGKPGGGETDIAAVCRSSDGGATWGGYSVAASDPLFNVQFCEPSIVELSPGKLLCMSRGHYIQDPAKGADSGVPMYLYQSESDDGGRTWTNLHRTDIWGHPAHLLELADGRVLCTYGYRRHPFGVRGCISPDGGRTWDLENELILYTGGKGFDLGYPCSVQRDDGVVITAWYESSHPGVSELQALLYTLG